MSFAPRLTAALALLSVVAAPVAARPYYGHGGYHGGYHRYHGGGIGVGGALLGAALIGGIAVAASNADRDRGYEPAYRDGPYEGDYAPPVEYGDAYRDDHRGDAAVEDCARAAEASASRRGGIAHVTGIDRVDPIAGGANVLGTLEIDNGRAYAVTRIGWSCRAAYGRVTGVRLG